jgi:hypothetical protein
MKIYINNLNIDILSAIMSKIKEQYITSETYIQIYANDGIYQINDKTIQKCNPDDHEIQLHNNYYENYTLIVDPSYYALETVNKIPLEHISTKMKKCFYQINKHSAITLVIEGPIIEDSAIKNKPITDYHINPCDLYFETPDSIDITNTLIKKEINVFLSLLN